MAIEVKKPTTSYQAVEVWTNPSNCYDQSGVGGDETTYGYQTLDADYFPSIRFHTWEIKGQTYTATVLKIKWKTSIQTGDDEVGVEYTKDGTNWYDLLVKGVNRSVGYTTTQIDIDANQDLTRVEIRVNSDKVKGADGCQFQLSDAWTEGTYTGIIQKNVSDSGSGDDSKVIVKNSFAISDIGSGADLIAGLINRFTISDLGSGIDLAKWEGLIIIDDTGDGTGKITVKAAFTISELGAGGDALSIKNNLIILDVVSGADILDIHAALSLSDSGGGTDAVFLKMIKEVLDSGSGADAIIELINKFTLSDVGSGVDSIQLKLPISVTDIGSAIDAIVNQISFMIQDSGSGSDTVVVIGKFLIVDSVGGTDVVSLTSVKFTVSDTGVGTDAIVSISTQVPISDAGSGDDSTISILIEVPIADTGTGSDTPITVVVKIPVVDYGTGDDSTISISMAIPVSDTGLGSDAIANILNKFTLLDSGSGVDAIVANIFLLLSDVGSGVDAINIALVIPIADSGSGADTVDFKIEIPITETGVGNDVITAILNKFTVSDTGIGVDAVVAKFLALISDSGSGSDAFDIKTGIPIIDTAVGTDTILSISAQIPIADGGIGVDVIADLIVKTLISEVATGTETAVSIGIKVPIADTGSGVDAIADLVNRLSVSDIGSGADDLAIQIQMTIADSGSGSDAIVDIKVGVTIADSGTGVDAVLLKLFKSVSDAGVGADSVLVVGKYNVSDSGAGTDLIVFIIAQVPITDVGIGIDSILKNITSRLDRLGVGFFIETPSPIVFAKILKSTDRSLPIPDLWYMSNILTLQADCVIEEQMKNYLFTNGLKIEGPCGLSTGTGKLTFINLSGVTISSYSGTATPSISNNDINITAGTLYNLKLSDGTWIPNPTDGYDISGGENHATPSNLTESIQDDLNTLQDLGFTAVVVNEFDPTDRISYDVYRKPIYVPVGGEFSIVEHPAGLYTLNDGGKIDFNSIRDKDMLDVEENPDVGLNIPGSWTLGAGVSISNNKIVVNGTQGSPTHAYIIANSTLYNANNRKFEVVYRCVSRTAGQHRVMLGGYGGSIYSSTVGPMKVELIVSNPSANNRLYYYFDTDFAGEVELLSAREIIKEPVKYHLDDEVLLNSNFEDGFTNGLADDWNKYEANNIVEEEVDIIHGKRSSQKIIATANTQNLGIEQSTSIDSCFINHFAWVFCSKNFGIDAVHLQLTDNYDKAFSLPSRIWTKIYWNSYPMATGSKTFRIYIDPANIHEDDYIIVDDCSFRHTILNPYFLHMFNKNAVVGNGDGFPEVYSAGMRSGNNNYDMLNPYKWVFEELNQTYLATYLQTAFADKLFMKLIKNDDGDVIALKNILSYKYKLTGMDLKRVQRYFG